MVIPQQAIPAPRSAGLSDPAQILTLRHPVQVGIGRDLEQIQHLVQHLPVLGRDDNTRVSQAACAFRGIALLIDDPEPS